VSLFPKEHGAYGQLAFPLVTSLAVAGVTTPALLIALAAVSGFLLHEPLVVLLGRRGARAKRLQRHRAAVWLGMTMATTIGAGLATVWSLAPEIRWSLVLPLVPALFAGVAIAAKFEKSSIGEVAVALMFSFVAVPMCLAAGAPTGTALAVGIAFGLVFVAGTLAVRVMVIAVRGGATPRAARPLRMAILMLTSVASLALVAAASRTLLPWTTLLAAAPGLAGASWLAIFPPSPARLRMVGWTLVTVSAGAALILIVGLAGGQ